MFDGLSVVWPQNRWDGFLCFVLKTGSCGLVIWASKSPRRFLGLAIKITATFSWFGPQNQASFSLSVAPQNRRREDGVGHASRSSGLLCVETIRSRVFQSGLKTGGGATAGGERGIITDVALSSSQRWRGYIRPCYPYFAVFYVLDHMSILVFCLSL
jgi:hypothetical protein